MRALLVNPWIYDFASYDLWSKPLGLLTIAANLKKLGCEIELIDCLDRFHPALKKFLRGNALPGTCFGDGSYYSETIEKPVIFKDIPRRFKRYGFPKELFRAIINDTKTPDIILITTAMTYWYPAYVDTIKMLKGRFGNSMPIVLGGNYVNLCFEHAKLSSGADVVYKGRDMVQIVNLVGKLTGREFDLSLINDGRHPYPAYELYPDLKYVTLKTSGGCPFRCTYCGWYLLEDRFTQNEPDFVIDEIEYFYKKFNIRNFSFYDDALLYNAQNHIVKILEGLIERKIKANFHTPNGLHNRFVTARLAGLFKKSGFIKPRLALETSSQKRQTESGQKTTNDEFLNALTCFRKAGYESKDISVYILMGLPNQSTDEMRESIRFAASQKVRIFLEEYSPIPHTPDYEKSGLEPGADPLLHNNSAFPLYKPDRHSEFQDIKTWVHTLNNELSIA